MNKYSYLTHPSFIGLVVLVVMIVVGGYIIAIGEEIPDILLTAFLTVLGITLGVQIPNKPMKGNKE